jgi:hypothetical protein
MEILKLLVSIAQCLLPLVEKQFNVLPVNPAIRLEVMPFSIGLALLCGLGGYVSVKKNPGLHLKLGWGGVVIAVLCFLAILGITSGGIPLAPLLASGAVRAAYAILFGGVGLALGGFLG